MNKVTEEQALAEARMIFHDAYFNADSEDKLNAALKRIYLAMHRSPTDTKEGEAYRMTADEHDAMDKALLDSVTVRGHLKRDGQPTTNTEQVERVVTDAMLLQARFNRRIGRLTLGDIKVLAQAAINTLQGDKA